MVLGAVKGRAQARAARGFTHKRGERASATPRFDCRCPPAHRMLDSAHEAAGAYERHGFVLASSVDRDDLRRGRNKNRE